MVREALLLVKMCLSKAVASVSRKRPISRRAGKTARPHSHGRHSYPSAILKLKELIDSGELERIQYIYFKLTHLGKIRWENILWNFALDDISVILVYQQRG
jgi:hypothetical protein